jgi:hypothetical protein
MSRDRESERGEVELAFGIGAARIPATIDPVDTPRLIVIDRLAD